MSRTSAINNLPTINSSKLTTDTVIVLVEVHHIVFSDYRNRTSRLYFRLLSRDRAGKKSRLVDNIEARPRVLKFIYGTTPVKFQAKVEMVDNF